MLCNNASVTQGVPMVTERWHSWSKSYGTKVCGNVNWSVVGNENIYMRVGMYNAGLSTKTVVARVDWTETKNGNITNRYIESTIQVDPGNSIGSFFYIVSGVFQEYEPDTTYTITKVTFDNVVQTPSEPTNVCSTLTVGSSIIVPTVTITDVTFAYETSSGVCTAIDASCNETMITLSGKHVSALCKITCDRKAAFNIVMQYTGPSGFVMIPVSIVQNVGSQWYCFGDYTNAGLWQIGNYSGLTLTALDITPG